MHVAGSGTLKLPPINAAPLDNSNDYCTLQRWLSNLASLRWQGVQPCLFEITNAGLFFFHVSYLRIKYHTYVSRIILCTYDTFTYDTGHP